MFAKIKFYWGAFVISSIVALVMIPLIYIFPLKKGSIMHYLNRVILKLIGAKYEEIGEFDPTVDMVFMNHQGIIDIITMEAVANRNMRWVAKKELFDTPWFGLLLKGGEMISVDRENKAGLLKLINDIKKGLKENPNRVIAIFPEGTRASDQKLLPFKSGASFVAKKLNLKVQPIVITGSKWVLNEHDKTAHNGTVRIHYLPPVDVSTANKEWYKDIATNMQRVIDNEEKEYGIKR